MFLEDLEPVTTLLSFATHPPEFTDPTTFSRPVPLMLTAIWEAFHLRCVSEATSFLSGFCSSANQLPEALRKVIAQELKQDSNELAVWLVADEGWKGKLLARVSSDALWLGSGKSKRLDDYYLKALGLKNLSASWRSPTKVRKSAAEILDEFIKIRDVITHQGEQHLSTEECWNFRQQVVEQVVRTISCVNKHVQQHCSVKFSEAGMSGLRRDLEQPTPSIERIVGAKPPSAAHVKR